jgi:hypothetical protein
MKEKFKKLLSELEEESTVDSATIKLLNGISGMYADAARSENLPSIREINSELKRNTLAFGQAVGKHAQAQEKQQQSSSAGR